MLKYDSRLITGLCEEGAPIEVTITGSTDVEAASEAAAGVESTSGVCTDEDAAAASTGGGVVVVVEAVESSGFLDTLSGCEIDEALCDNVSDSARVIPSSLGDREECCWSEDGGGFAVQNL